MLLDITFLTNAVIKINLIFSFKTNFKANLILQRDQIRKNFYLPGVQTILNKLLFHITHVNG